MGPTRTKRLAVCACALAAIGLLGLLSLDLALRLAVSSRAEPDRGQDAIVRERLRETLTALVSNGDRESHDRQWQVARWLSGRCADLGYRVEIREYEQKGERWPNVVASRVSLSAQAELVVAMAHLDSRSEDSRGEAPGADDNASGVAVLLEVARALRDVDTDRPITFCFFSNEEAGHGGSRAFAGWARRQDLRIPAAVNVDVVGYSRPTRLLDWSAVAAQVSWRGRGRAVWLQVRNGITALREGRNALLVAGRMPNRGLVGRVGGALERGSGPAVVRKAHDDCG